MNAAELDRILDRLNERLALPSVVDMPVIYDPDAKPEPTGPAFVIRPAPRRFLRRNDATQVVEFVADDGEGTTRVIGGATYELLDRSAVDPEDLIAHTFRIPVPPPRPPKMPSPEEMRRVADAIRSRVAEEGLS